MNIRRLIYDQQGAALAMVLIMLVATIIIGICIMRTSTTGMRIAANERIYVEDFYNAEGASQFAISQLDRIVYQFPNMTTQEKDIMGNLKALLDTSGTNKKLTGNPTIRISLDPSKGSSVPVGTGNSAGITSARFYVIKSRAGSQEIEARVWVAYPKLTDDIE